MISRPATGQWLTGSDGVRWFFDAGALSLDFAYTGDFGFGVAAWEHWHRPQDLDGWLEARFAGAASARRIACDDALFAEALALRAAVSRLARWAAEGTAFSPHDVDTINEWAAQPAATPLLPGGSRPLTEPSPRAMLATIAQDAVALFSTPGGRIRQCAASDCRLIFFDASRAGSRRWCSMKRCGNRAKTRAHYRRAHD
ncbi:MAG: CGNR zinc finger domain-containing protein [Actinobacteria bacterium]|nr:CGNR zinc finger domain-containing protein [Actinomycetota bacterium]